MRRTLRSSLLLVAAMSLAACGHAADSTNDDTTAPSPTVEPTATSFPTSADCSAAGTTGDSYA